MNLFARKFKSQLKFFMAVSLFLVSPSHGQIGFSTGKIESIGITDLSEFDKNLTACFEERKKDCFQKFIKDRLSPNADMETKIKHFQQKKRGQGF